MNAYYTKTPIKTKLARLEPGKKYSSSRLVEIFGIIGFEYLIDNNKLQWIGDDTFGDKLYIKEDIK